jgi:prepilin-type N-terminal cleavage/methylation domain-containing protein/prepilin-type processing-associated H-X9-DG protein
MTSGCVLFLGPSTANVAAPEHRWLPGMFVAQHPGSGGSSCRKGGFTLLELLVVIGIIALLLAILLPALNKARRASQTTACLGNLHSIGQAMVMYASDNRGWLPGSGWTSGRQFWSSTSPASSVTFTSTNCPTINESNDWVGPLAREMGIVDPNIDGVDSGARYNTYRQLGWMICPSYLDQPVPAKSPVSANEIDDGSGQGLSYCISLAFVNEPRSAVGAGTASEVNGELVPPLSAGTTAIITLPNGYGPQLSDVVNSSEKVFAADGARSIVAGSASGPATVNPPFYVISGTPSSTGWDHTSYGDYGAFGGYSHSWYRIAVPGNCTNPPAQDVRIWAYRHGTLSPFQQAGAYRMNLVYFDGHAETLDDVAAANPALWMPSGSTITPYDGAGGSAVAGTKTVWADVLSKYCPGITADGQVWTAP